MDLTNFSLKHHILRLATAIRESTSLLSVHLGENSMNLEDIQTFLVQLGIDYRDLGPKFINQAAVSDKPHDSFLEKELSFPIKPAPSKYSLKGKNRGPPPYE